MVIIKPANNREPKKSPNSVNSVLLDERGKFKKGHPKVGGSKKGDSFSLLALLKQELQKCPKGQDKKTYAYLIIKRMLKEAIEKGDPQQIKLIWAYIEGQPKETGDLNIKLTLHDALKANAERRKKQTNGQDNRQFDDRA